VELDHLEVCAFGGELADQVQDQVLGVDPTRELAFDHYLDGARHFDIENTPQGPDRSHLRGPDAKSKGAERAVRGRVAVGAHHHLARPHVTVFGEDLVADAAHVTANVVEPGDSLLRDKIADLLVVGCRLRRLGGHAVVEDDRDPARIPHPRLPSGVPEDLVELVDNECSVLVRHRQVHRQLEDFPCFHASPPARPGEQLLYIGHAHINLLLSIAVR